MGFDGNMMLKLGTQLKEKTSLNLQAKMIDSAGCAGAQGITKVSGEPFALTSLWIIYDFYRTQCPPIHSSWTAMSIWWVKRDNYYYYCCYSLLTHYAFRHSRVARSLWWPPWPLSLCLRACWRFSCTVAELGPRISCTRIRYIWNRSQFPPSSELRPINCFYCFLIICSLICNSISLRIPEWRTTSTTWTNTLR